MGLERRTGLEQTSAARQAAGRLSTPALAAIVVAAYFGAAKLGLNLAHAHTSISAIWPPAGIALAAVLLGGYRMLPAVAVGAFLANVTTEAPMSVVLGISVGNTLEALAGAWLLRRARLDPSLERIRDVVAIVTLAAVISTAISASVGVGSLSAFGGLPGSEIPSAWRTWWLGDMGGDLIVASALLVFASTPRTWLRSRDAALSLSLSLLVGAIALLILRDDSGFPYLVLPLLFALALVCGQRGAVIGGLIVSTVAVWLTARGYGPFVHGTPDGDLARTQMFVGVGAISGLLVAAARSERGVAERARTPCQQRTGARRRPADRAGGEL